MVIEMKNELLNLPTLQLKVDHIVFDHIDTNPNWSLAYEQLDELLQKVATNFNCYVGKNDDELPGQTTYWTLYMDIAAKLLYFTGLAHSQLLAEEEADARAHIIELYKLSASCIPNAQREHNEEILSEIKKSIQYLNGNQPVELHVSTTVEQCIENFASFTKSYEQ